MNYVERCLYDYLENVVKLYMLQMDLSCLMSVQGQSYNLHSGNGVSNPVFEITSRLMTLERKIYQIEKRVKPVRQLKSELIGTDERIQHMMSILRLRYFRHMQHDEVIVQALQLVLNLFPIVFRDLNRTGRILHQEDRLPLEERNGGFYEDVIMRHIRVLKVNQSPSSTD